MAHDSSDPRDDALVDSPVDPQDRFWTAARRSAVIAVVTLAGVRAALTDTGVGNAAEFVIGVLLGALTIGFALIAMRLIVLLFRTVPGTTLASLGSVLLALLFLAAYSPAEIVRTLLDRDAWEWPLGAPHGLQGWAVFVMVLAVALLTGLAAIMRAGGLSALPPGRRNALLASTVATLAAGAILIAGLASDGGDPFQSDYRTLAGRPAGTVDDRGALQIALPIALPDPSSPGRFAVDVLSYGAGDNLRRPEFGRGRDIESRVVDAAALLPEWKGIKQRMRERYWGFGLDQAPLNALVWAPRDAGPFPLVLIVHGNHSMEEYSDPGYGYLGELLASRGFIAVSVDQNYINGSWSGDFQGKEMALRAWLLLEHLKLWRDWNVAPVHRFSARVDMSRIALIGHSRGGEAVSIAHAFNGLPHFPDDATVAFDYGFDIRSLVAIAQIDQRYHRRVELENVSFLALQGSYDSDEPAFHGLRQFNRIELEPDDYRFKAGIYVHGANHGQFNSIWGREDLGPPQAWLLNLAPIISAGDQQRIAAVYISAFLEATLNEDRRFIRLFRDPRAAADWLPDLAYVHQFTDSTFIPLATFDEDLDVTTATADGATLTAEGFALWREDELKHRDERLQGTSAVVLGWRARDRPVYSIRVPDSFWPEDVGADDLLTFSISASTEKLPDDDVEEDGKEEDIADDEPGDAGVAAPRFAIEVVDASGAVRTLASADVAHLAPPLRVQYLKSGRLNKERYNADWEAVLQAVEIPLGAFAADDETWDIGQIRELRLRFEADRPGVVILDDLGLQRPPG